MNHYVVKSFIQSLLIAMVLISVVLIVAFRSFKLGGLALIPNFIPLILGGAMLKLLGHSLDVGTVVVAALCLGIAVDDTIHILANYLKRREAGYDPRSAIAMVLTHTGAALVATTLVLVGAFGTFGFGTFVPNVYLGIMTALILSTALLTDLTLLPALLMARASRKEMVARGHEERDGGTAGVEVGSVLDHSTNKRG